MKGHNIVKWGFFIYLSLMINQLSGQSMQIPVNLAKLVEQSFMKYSRMEEMKDLVKLSEIRVSIGKAGYLPVAGADLSYRRMYPTPEISIPSGTTTHNIQIQPANNYNIGISVAQPLVDLQIPANVEKAKSDLTTSRDNLENFKIQLAYQLAQVYYSILFLNRSLAVHQDQLDLLKSDLQLIEAKVKNGDALSYDLVSTQVRYTNAENLYIDLKTQVNKLYNLLNMLTGNTGSDYLTDTLVEENTFSIPGDSVLFKAMQYNPELKIATDKMNSAAWDITLANRSRFPTLNLLAGTGYKNGYVPDIQTTLFNYYVGIGLSVPMMVASRANLRKKMAVVSLSSARQSLETQKMTLNRDLMNALDDVNRNEKVLLSADTLIQKAQLALNLATDRYKYGVITNLDLLTSMTNLKDAQLSRLQFEYNLLLSRLEMCRLAGIVWW